MYSKKTLKASEQDREDIAQQREQWLEFQMNVEPYRLVFLDESGVKTNMARLYGRSSGGVRCHDKAQSMVTGDDAQGWFKSCGYIKS